MAIELDLAIRTARKLRALLRDQCTDTDLADLFYALDGALERHDAAVAAKAPWRKVVGRDKAGLYHAEMLECGHRRLLRTSRNWVEDWGTRRRCEDCKHAAEREAANNPTKSENTA